MPSKKPKTFGKKFFSLILKIIYIIFFSVMVYQVLVLILGFVPVNKDFKQTPGGIEIFIGTNGVHTDIVMPVKSNLIDWRELVPLYDFPKVDTSYQYISIGWGDKGFYINTPTWSDLTLGTAFKALFLASETAMHVTYVYSAPQKKENYVSVFISEEQYQRLINFIEPYFQTHIDGAPILVPESGYSYNDNFYEAYDNYHLFNTSNNWTNKALKKTGVRTAYWSPLDRPIMLQLKRIRE